MSANAKSETGNAVTAKVVVTNQNSGLLLLGNTTQELGVVQQTALALEKAAAAELKQKQKLIINQNKITKIISKLKSRVGKTPYVPFGASPSGWDCSGMVTWAYAQVGIDLYHGASHQKHSGKMVKTPKVGDIVAFGWTGWSGAQHSGIYLGDGKMLHAGGHVGMRTEVADISEWAKGSGNTLITYTRILTN
jgi:cell wall-associated NlpC family hydrolase